SIHNGHPWNNRTDSHTRLIGVMYSGKDEDDLKDDIIFYGMNAYWEPLNMQLPELPGNMRWKVCVNTSVEYEDGKDMEQETEFRDKVNLMIPPRTVVVLEAEMME
ncbi:MAG: glycogen debranching enzyme, partial [Lachnospiraceae bacterium]|nr:glycogen debranching enzyme [Lachnospiraceae bacterium]